MTVLAPPSMVLGWQKPLSQPRCGNLSRELVGPGSGRNAMSGSCPRSGHCNAKVYLAFDRGLFALAITGEIFMGLMGVALG